MGGILIRPQIPKIFRLRRAKNRVFGVFGAKKNSACGGPKIVFCMFLEPKIFRLRRAYNKAAFQRVLRAEERASTIRKTI